MDLIYDPDAKREADRVQANRDELVERISQAIRQDGTMEPLPGLRLNRSSSLSKCVHSVSVPAFCAISQGSKEVLVGSDRYRLSPRQGGYTHHIARAIERLRQDFNQPLRIESIARELGMSVSGFHHHFKSVTAMSPLQFQKQLRLQEARRLMLVENLGATGAAYRVGYDDPSYFNREYKRHFGAPPIRDVERLRETARVSV